MKANPYDPPATLQRAKQYLTEGRFLLALDLCCEVAWWLDKQQPTLDTELLRTELEPVMSEAQRQADEAVRPRQGVTHP